MVPSPSATDACAAPLGVAFARALGRQDRESILQLLAPDITFSGLTPGGSWEASSADDVVDKVILGRWFSSDRHITQVLQVEATQVCGLDHVRYRFAVDRPDGSFVVEQHAYYETASGAISSMRILCSGFLSASEA
jgi:hypothetical protein